MSFLNFGTPEMRLKNARGYADDYKIVSVTDENGKTRKRTVYQGIWYFLRDDTEKILRCTLFSALSAVLSFLTCIGTLLLNSGPSGSLFVMIPQALSLFPGLYGLLGATELPYRGKPMERNRYMHGMIRMCRAGTAGSIFMAVSLVAGLIWRIVGGDWMFLRGDVLQLLLLVISVVLFFVPVVLLQKLDVFERPNEDYRPGRD